ncbi:hypothetical protein [Rugamonas sp.]|uniref:hypothetical protein n=1 Tax=Rugamonas sp. TaxID=1926287 RepID=UPI0025F22DFD|nr:hypothetical protein [Rugamonas sp.]
MQTGTQLCAFEGFETLKKGRVYHLLRSDAAKQRVLLVEFGPSELSEKNLMDAGLADVGTAPPISHKSAKSSSRPSFAFKPVLHYLSRYSFEQGVDAGLIAPCEHQEELPPWLASLSIDELRAYSLHGKTRKRSHDQRIDQTMLHLWPLVQNLDQVLTADAPDAVINAHARACKPRQNEMRLRIAFYAYVCFGLSRWALHYAVNRIGRWDRSGRQKKFGRPSRLYGANHGYNANDPEMIKRMLEGYRTFAGPGQHFNRIYHRTLISVFGCVVQNKSSGRKVFVHPAGRPFPSFGQFAYRVNLEFPLEVRQTYKYGYAGGRDTLWHSQGRFAESVGNLMERTEQDAYCCIQVAKGYLQGSHLPPLWVVRIRCITSGMIVGIGFSFGSETAAAYRMALFCAAIDKMKFCGLFGIDICHDDWPSIGLSPHIVNDRGPGSTAKAELAIEGLNAMIKEAAPSYSGQSKASIETTHPKQVNQKGKPHYLETRLTIPQIAVQEIMRTIADNQCIDVTDRLNNLALSENVFPTPVGLWKYLDSKGRNVSIPTVFDEAVRACLLPVEVTVRDDAVYFKDSRFESEELKQSGILQKAHDLGRYVLTGYILDTCVRHLWVDIGGHLVQVDAMLAIRDGQEQLYISVLEIEQLQQIRRDAKLELKSHRLAVKAQYETAFQDYTGKPFEQSEVKSGRSRRSKGASREEAQQVAEYLRAGGRR